MFKVDIYSLALTILYIVLNPNIPKLTDLDKLNNSTHDAKIKTLLQHFSQCFINYDDQNEVQHFITIITKILAYIPGTRKDSLELYMDLTEFKEYYGI